MPNTPYILPPNISGFSDDGAVPELAVNDLQNYCEVACEAHGYSLLRFIDLSNKPNRSYHLCCIQKGEHKGVIFLNKYHKVVAFSTLHENMPVYYDGSAEMPRNEFIDLEDLGSAFAQHYMVLPVQVLLLPLDSDIPESAEVVQQLKDVEFGEFSYWVPQTIGQVVFNGWTKQ